MEIAWKLVQSEAYRDEVAVLSKNKDLSSGKQAGLEKSSVLLNLTPMMDDDGILRVDGRISAAKGIPIDVKFPVILPRKHYITHLILDDYHKRRLHANFETVVNEVRQRYHIPRQRTTVRSVVSHCQWCKIHKARPQTPMMGLLPTARLSPGIRPEFARLGMLASTISGLSR